MPDFELGRAYMTPMLQMQQLGMNDVQQQRNEIALKGDQMNLAERQRMQTVMAGLAKNAGPNADPLELLDKAAGEALRAGMLTQAEDALKVSGLAMQRKAHAEEYKAQAQERQLKTEAGKVDMFVNLANMFPDSQAGWDALKSAYMAQNPKLGPMEQQILGMQWRPGLAGQLKGAFMTAKDKALAQWRESETDRKAAHDEDQAAHWERQDKVNAARAAAYDRRVAQMGKAGGKAGAVAAGVPTQKQESDAEAVLEDFRSANDLPDFDATQKRNLARDIASRARALQAESKQSGGALDWAEALDEALEEFKDRIEEPTGGFMGFGKKTPIRSRQSPAAANTGSATKDISQADYAALPDGAKFWYGGKEYTKGAK